MRLDALKTINKLALTAAVILVPSLTNVTFGQARQTIKSTKPTSSTSVKTTPMKVADRPSIAIAQELQELQNYNPPIMTEDSIGNYILTYVSKDKKQIYKITGSNSDGNKIFNKNGFKTIELVIKLGEKTEDVFKQFNQIDQNDRVNPSKMIDVSSYRYIGQNQKILLDYTPDEVKSILDHERMWSVEKRPVPITNLKLAGTLKEFNTNFMAPETFESTGVGYKINVTSKDAHYTVEANINHSMQKTNGNIIVTGDDIDELTLRTSFDPASETIQTYTRKPTGSVVTEQQRRFNSKTRLWDETQREYTGIQAKQQLESMNRIIFKPEKR